MNLFKKQKFSIRKFNIGTFSALIATVVFLGQSNQASADEEPVNDINQLEHSTKEEQNNNLNPNTNDIEKNSLNSEKTDNSVSPTPELKTTNNDEVNRKEKDNLIDNNINMPSNTEGQDSTQVNENLPTVDTSKFNHEKAPKDVYSNNSNKPQVPIVNSTLETISDKPKKRSRRDVTSTNGNGVNTNSAL